DQPGDLVGAAAGGHRDTHEDLGPLVGRQRLPHRLLGRVDRPPRLVRAGLRDAADDLAGVGRANLEPVAGLDPLAGDEELAFQGGCGHAASLGNSCAWVSTSATRGAAPSRSPTRLSARETRISSSYRTSSPISSTRGSRRTGVSSTSGWLDRSG